MTDVDALFQVIRSLPVRERLQLVERVVHDLAEISPGEVQTAAAETYPIGLFADDPDAVDEMMATVMEMRRDSRLRGLEDDGATEGSS
jgi:hypothetical protein